MIYWNAGPLPEDSLCKALEAVRRLAETAVRRQAEFAAAPHLLPEFEWELEQRMISALRARFPDVPVLAEEAFSRSGDTGGEGALRFVLDPIDGSRSYLRGSPLFAVSLALCEDDRPLLGFVLQPATGALFSAAAGAGSFLDGRRLGPVTALDDRTVSIRSTVRSQPEVARLVRYVEDLEFAAEERMWCSSLKICWVATGRRAGVVKRLSRRHGHRTWWGTAAGLLVAQEAGAAAVTLGGADWAGQDGELLIVNPRLLDLLRTAGWPAP